jgi:hypothetical protein
MTLSSRLLSHDLSVGKFAKPALPLKFVTEVNQEQDQHDKPRRKGQPCTIQPVHERQL